MARFAAKGNAITFFPLREVSPFSVRRDSDDRRCWRRAEGPRWGGYGSYLPPTHSLSRAAPGMDVRLIAEVSRWPILYNTSCEEYKNVEMKNHAWREITFNLFGSANPIVIEKVKNKWKNLRDTFVKAQRKKDKPNAKPWKLEGEMKFLIPHINLKGTNQIIDGFNPSVERRFTSSPEDRCDGSSWEVDVIKKEKGDDESAHPDDDILQHVETVMEEVPRREVFPKRKRKRESFNNAAATGVHFLDSGESLYDQMQNPGTYDNIDYFFLGLAASVKRLRPINQISLKRAIANLVFDTEMKELEVSNYEATSSS